MTNRPRWIVAAGLLLAWQAHGAEVELVTANTPWRAFLVVGPNVEKDNGTAVVSGGPRGAKVTLGTATAELEKCGFSRLPDAHWTQPNTDVSAWARYIQSDLADFLGDYGVQRSGGARGATPALLCLRSAFGSSDPARATDLKVTVVGLGGVVVYVNGREVGRGALPQGALHPLTPADSYPPEAYTLEDGTTLLPELALTTKPDEKSLPRYQRRIRTFTFSVPADALVKGGNVLCVEVHPALTLPSFSRANWVHLGVHSIRVASASGAGAISHAESVRGTWAWSANPEDQIADPPTSLSLLRRAEGRPVMWMRGKAVRGIQCGSPFDPVLPIRMAAPRNGVASGQTVVTDLDGLKGVSAAVSPLKGPQGEIPAGAVEIRYAAQRPPIHFCDALLPAPTDGAKTTPVWMIVQVPKNQAPGWYTGTLGVKANDKSFSVPVQVLVSGLTLPDARDFTSMIGASCAADTLAAHYNVEPWSAEHFRLMEPSLRMAGQLGNDVLYVPVILGGMSVSFRNKMTGGSATSRRFRPLVRFIKEGDRLVPEFSLLEKFLDVYVKHCAPPKALSFYVWEAGCSKEIGFAYENSKIAGAATTELPGRPGQPTSKLLVLQWDPKTGATTEVEAPAITDEGAEPFYKALFGGVRARVVRRGWPENIILAGLGGDLRPGHKSGEILRQWLPYVRWNLLSHFSGDPAPKNGKMIATGNLEVGLKEYPWRGTFLRPYSAAELEQDLTSHAEFMDLPTARWMWQDDCPPSLFRTLPLQWGALGHLGLDFWTHVRGVPGNTSFFTSSCALTVPGTNGAEPTVRFQMLREGVQDMEVRMTIARACLKLPEPERAPCRELLDEYVKRVAWSSGYLGQFELGYGWRAYAAKVQQTAAELAGVKSEAKWEGPPK